MPDRPDYSALTRGQIALLERISTGDTGLAMLGRLVRLAQDVLGALGAGFAEYGPGHGRVIACAGRCAGALGRRVTVPEADRTQFLPLDALDDAIAGRGDGTDIRYVLGTPCAVGDAVVGALYVSYGEGGEPGPEHHAVLELLAATAGHLYGRQAGFPVHGDGPVVAALADGLAVVDRDRVVQLWNPAAERLTGRTAAEALHHELPFPVPPPGQVLVHHLPSGRRLKVTAGDLPRTPAMRVVTFRDSTDQDRRHEDRDLFVAVTSHELRTPVTVIKGYADTLTNHWDSLGDQGRQDAVRAIGARAGELARLVDRLLSATSEDGEVGGAPPGPFDLADALRAAAAALPAGLRRRLVLENLPGDLPKAFGDRDSLATILTELATNADKYSPAETEVTVTAAGDESTVTFRVADRGIGIRPEHVERAFERYWQGTAGAGAGLGLYLVRRIVERQHGWVSLRPRQGGGTVAEVRFPRA
ncbi:sensor histidine kinase [Couchioplanes caeruleus]|uniref:histidine kinase n=2 Tax=Couchioplanes caeruleus TaxID=56438 RepID=A0A1K0FLU5_9ACTN|nr:ATP-binding protein [Couchioplanes caeruleus]OJF13821.1 PAS domain-containing sensor histidine kinase [Couchioplanes caeruleus subsp. caeruleus]ROP31193.1 PAS/PAC sensor signal transduction histidine kinase [Couchioplanes caeruleus]